MATVYLAGPIAGLSYAGATNWRDEAIRTLAESGIKGLSPMRAKEHLRHVGAKIEHPYPVGTRVRVHALEGDGVVLSHGPKWLSYNVQIDGVAGTSHVHKSMVAALATDIGFSATCDEYGDLSPLSSARGIMTRDRFDANRCDVLLVNLLGATKVSIGTVMEIAWADAKRTPIVVAMEPSGNPHEHAMVTEAIGMRCSTLDEAISCVKAILA